MAQQFLDRPDVIACFEQVRGKGMPEGMATHVLDDARLMPRFDFTAESESNGAVNPEGSVQRRVGEFAAGFSDRQKQP